MRRSRSLIATLFALTALATAAPPAALAEEFEASELPAAITGAGEGTAIFKVGSLEIKCSAVALSGTFAAVGSTLSLSPELSGCKAFGGELNVTATTAGCKVVFDLDGTLDIACEGGNTIKFKDAINLCTVSVPSQSGSPSMAYENSEAKAEPTVTYAGSVNNMTATVSGGFLCPSVGHYGTATFASSGRLEAKDEEGGAVAFWMKKPRILCKQEPNGNPLACPQGYNGEVKGTLKQNAVFESKGGATGSVTCKAATFTGEGFTEEGKGSVKIVYNAGAACESKIVGLEEPKVVLEKGKAYGASEFIYIRAVPFQGRIWLTTAPPAVAQLDLEGKALTCSYELKSSSANIFNPVAVGEEVKPMEAKLIGSVWNRSAGGAQCPTKLRSETIFTLEQAGGGNLWVTGQ